jgi:hypothetical protein
MATEQCKMCYGKKKLHIGSADVDKYEYSIEPCPKCTAGEAEHSIIEWN